MGYLTGCLTSAKFNMLADVLRQGVQVNTPSDNTDIEGQYRPQQDPISGEIIRVWQPSSNVDDPTTPGDERVTTMPVMARAILSDGGIRVVGTTERFGRASEYGSVDYVRIRFPSNFIVTKRDRLTNVRDSDGNVIWVEEELRPNEDNLYRPTVFNVNGVSPVIDPFGRLMEWEALLERAEF